MLRYRDHSGGVTQRSLQRMDRALSKLGRITSVKGYRYRGRYGTDEAVLVRGENGTARFEGVLWGYYGEGSAGLVTLLRKIGVHADHARKVAYETHRCYSIGTDWTLRFDLPTLI